MRIGIVIILLVLALIFIPAKKNHALDTSKIQVVSIKKITTEGYYGIPKWSPDGTKLYTTVYDKTQKRSGWVIMNPDGTSKQIRWDDKFPEDYSPDKTRYVYIGDDKHLWKANADGSNPQRIPNTQYATDPRWSPDGSMIIFQVSEQVFAVSPDGSNLQEIYNFKGKGALWGEFAWSPDGKSVAAGLNVNMQWKKINTEKGTIIYTVAEKPIWSPDGKKIYSSTGAIKAFDITNLSVSEDLTKSGHKSASFFDINFSRGLVAYALSEDFIDPQTGAADSHVSLNNIWIMDINGMGHRKLTDDKGEFAWKEDVGISPDGRHIVFQNADESNIYIIELSYQ